MTPSVPRISTVLATFVPIWRGCFHKAAYKAVLIPSQKEITRDSAIGWLSRVRKWVALGEKSGAVRWSGEFCPL